MSNQKPDPDRTIRIGRAEEYPKQLWYLTASCIAAVAIAHHLVLLSAYINSRSSRPSTPSARGRVSILRLPLALLNVFRVVAFRTTVPISLDGSYVLNLSELFLSCAYIAALFTWSFINSTATTGKKLDPKYWANVAGNVAGSQLALMTALGMKNNIISFLTGVSFDKLSYLHRMSARVICLLTWIHGAGRLMIGFTGVVVTWAQPWVQCGLLASTSLTLLALLSVRPIREGYYEAFKIIHLIFGIIFILSAYFHANGLDDGVYVWPTILIWGLDRFARLIRIVLFSFNYLQKGKRTVDASVDVLSPHFLRVSIQRPSLFRWLPGQSAYLTFPTISFLQAHPFTICASDTEKSLIFLVRVRNGITRTLRDKASSSLPVIIDGPYSSPPAILGYDRVILVAGGSGIAFTLPLLLDLLNRTTKNTSASSPRKITFVWAIREAEHVEWVSGALLPVVENAPASTEVEIQIYVTGSPSGNDWDDDSIHEQSNEEDQEKATPPSTPSGIAPTLFSNSAVRVQQGRPNLTALVDNDMKFANGAISVTVCGTLALANAVRSTLRAPRFMDILRGGPSINLHVEAFGAQ